MKLEELEVPTVHMNGTLGDDLYQAYIAAYNAVDVAYTFVKYTAPNGRDYYVKPGAMTRAQEQHEARLRRLQEVMSELEYLAGQVFSQEDPR